MDFFEPRRKAMEIPCIKASANFPEKQLLFSVEAHDERSEKLSGAFGLCVAADHKFLFHEQFESDPSATSLPNLIDRILPFTDESLQSKFPRLLKKWQCIIIASSCGIELRPAAC